MDERESYINTLDSLSKCIYSGYENDKSLKMLDWFVKKFGLLSEAIRKKGQVVHRGEIYWCELGENIGSEEVKLRPCVIIQNQKGNEKAPTTIVAPITNTEINLPVAVSLDRGEGSPITGTIDLGQIRVISKGRLKGHIGNLKTGEEKNVNKAILRSLGLYKYVISDIEKGEKIRALSIELNNLKSLINSIKTELEVENIEDIAVSIKELKK